MVYFSFNHLVSQVEEATTRRSERAKPHCSLCHQPMKGHKNVIDCPRKQTGLIFVNKPLLLKKNVAVFVQVLCTMTTYFLYLSGVRFLQEIPPPLVKTKKQQSIGKKIY